MPLVNIEDDMPAYRQLETPEQDFTAGDIWGASFGTESDVYGAYRAYKNPMPDASSQETTDYMSGVFKPLDYMAGTRHDTDDRRNKYAEMQSPSQIAWMDAILDEEDADNNIRNASPWYQTIVPDMTASLLSPTTFIAGGASAATKGARAVQYGIKAVSATGAQEVLLQSQQETRAVEKSLGIVVGAGILGSGLGAITGKAGQRAVTIEDEFVGPMPQPTGTVAGGSGGAARVSTADPEAVNAIHNNPNLNPDQKIIALADLEAVAHSPINPAAAKAGGLGFMHKFIPEQRIVLNKNPVMRMFGDNTLNHPLIVKGNMEGKGGVALEEITRLPQKKIDHEIPIIVNKEGYSNYSKNFTGTKMAESEFEHAIQVAVSKGGKYADPEVQKVASRLMSEYLEPLKARLIRNDMLEDIKPLGDESWWPRSYSEGYALSVRPETYADQLMPGVIKRLEARVAAGGEDAALASKKLTTKGLKAERKRLIGMRNALAHGSKDFGSDYAGLGVMRDSNGILSPSKSRTLDIATEDIPAEMLRQDTIKSLTQRLKAYERQLTAYEDPRFGDPTFTNYKDMRRAFYEAELGELKRAGAKDKEIVQLAETLKKDLKEIDGIAHRYNGIRSTVVSAATQNVVTTLLAANSVTKLGRAILSQIPELVSTVGSVGGLGVVKHVVSTVLNPTVMRGIARQVRRDMAAGIEVASSLRFAEKGILDETSPAWAKMADKGADFIVDKMFGIGYWTRFIRAEAAVMVQSKVARLMLKDNLSKRNTYELARMGITEDLIPAVRAEILAHHTKVSGGTIDAGMGKWGNKDIQNIVETAIAGDVKHYQLEPGIGSMPFLGDSAHGALLLQFKAFIMMSTSRHLMPGIQKMSLMDPKALEQMIMMSAAGSLGYALRAQSYNRPVDTSPETLFREGVVRGGWFGMTGDFNALLEQFSGGQVSAFNAIPGFEEKTSSNYFGARTIYSTGIGPTGQYMKDLIDGSMGAYSMIMNGEASKGQIRSLRRMVPLNNYVAVNTPMFAPFNEAENYMIDKFAGGSRGGFLK